MSLLRVAGCGCELPLLRDGPRCKLCNTRVTLEAPTQAEIHARRARQHQTYKRITKDNSELAEKLREIMGKDFPRVSRIADAEMRTYERAGSSASRRPADGDRLHGHYHGNRPDHPLPEGSKTVKPIAIGTLVDYHGSCKHGRYIVTAHHCPHDLFPRNEWDEVKDYYPDGVAYEIWPEGMVGKFGLRHLSVYRVRRSSLTVVVASKVYTPEQMTEIREEIRMLCTREGFEPMEPFTEEI